MKVKILDLDGKEKGSMELPKQFDEEIRVDLIRRAVLSQQSFSRQPYGADPDAGKRYSAKLSRRRRAYKGSYGKGISRVPRKIIWRRGGQFYWVGAFAPGTVGGRRAHPPKTEKDFTEKINKKEKKKAIRCAISASMNLDFIRKRNHIAPSNFPFIVEKGVEKVNTTKKLKQVFIKLGFGEELERTDKKKIRAGKGKMRNRPYKTKKGILIVVGNKCNLEKSSKNLPGVDVVHIKSLNAELLAPGTVPGRLTLWTENAINVLSKENLFI